MSKLNELLKAITKDHVYILMHNYPDQDAIASAYGLQYILEWKGIRSSICYHGQVDKTDTLKMLSLLEINVYEQKNIHSTKEDQIIIVDGQMGNVNVRPMIGKVIACIDHHPVFHQYNYEFRDIRSEIGSCASIVSSYFQENNIEVTPKVATALLYGIKIDTSNLTRRVSLLDVDQFHSLYRIADIGMIETFTIGTLRRDDLQAYKEAISDLSIEYNIGIAKIGNDCSEAMIGTVSDFLIHLEEVNISIVYAMRDGGIRFSIRSDNRDIDAGRMIHLALEGYGDGGGHDQVAAGFVPNVNEIEDIQDLVRVIVDRINQMVSQGIYQDRVNYYEEELKI